MDTLYVQALGGLQVGYNGKTVSHFDTPKVQSVLVFLLLHCQTAQSRYHTAAVLWPASTDSQARTNLRKYIHRLRHTLPHADEFLCGDGNTIQWKRDDSLVFDVDEFEQSIEDARQARSNKDTDGRQAALATAVELYRGDLLPSCYEEWIFQPRQRLSQTYIQALFELALLFEKQRNYATAIHYLQRLLQHDPLRETAYRHLMRLHALEGDRATALQVFEQCRQILERELDVPPSQATQVVYERLIAIQPAVVHRHLETNRPVPLVGRQDAWEKLQAAWEIAVNQKPQFVVISGVAGIGKTRLAEELLHWAEQQGFATAATRTYAVQKPLAYAPLTDWLRTDTLKSARSRLDDVWLIELARLLPEVLVERRDLPRPEPLIDSWHRQRLFETIARAVLAIDQPLLLFIDDLQWSDEQTLDWLRYFIGLELRPKVLVLGTLRPEEVTAEHPLSQLDELYRNNQLTTATLPPLDPSESTKLAGYIVGHDFDTSETDRLYRETEGNPLFIVEMLRAKPSLSRLPETVQAVIKRRLLQISPAARTLVELASVIGRDFSLSAVMQASQLDEESLVTALDELSHRYVIQGRGGDHYDFTHDKIREVAYLNLSQARRRFLHHRVADALEAMSQAKDVAAELAYHYTEGGKIEKAVRYRLEAGEQALALSAYHEATKQLQRGLELLYTLPHTPDRDNVELKYLFALSSTLIPQKGFTAPELSELYDRAIQVVNQLGDEPRLIPFLYNVGQYFTFRQNWAATHELGTRCLHLAQQTNKVEDLVFAHGLLGISFTYSRHHVSAFQHLRQSLACYEQLPMPDSRLNDLGLMCRSHLGIVLWMLGYPDQALEEFERGLQQGRELSQMHGLVLMTNNLSITHILRREPVLAQKYAEQALVLSDEYQFPFWHSLADISLGWAMAQQGKLTYGLAAIREGLDTFDKLGTSIIPYTHALLADVYLSAGDITNGLLAVDEAIQSAAETKVEVILSMALRIKGDLLKRSNIALEEVENVYRQAIAFAQIQEAKSFELQATLSLCRLYQQQGKIAEARQLLNEIYNWLTEGFDTPDLREARALLDELV